MIIPKLHYIAQGNTPKEKLENIQKACTAGIELIQLDLKTLSEKKALNFAEKVREITSYFQTRLIINQQYKIAKSIKADGVHFDATTFNSIDVRKHLFTWQIVGATANTLHDCETLLEKQVDYITLSPFKSIKTIDATTVLGLNGYSLLLETLQTATPIIGFGDITSNDVSSILQTGVSGIAISEAITQNFDSIKVFNQLLKASSTEEKRHTF